MARQKPRTQHATIVQRFSIRLRELRTSRGMTQSELARLASVASSYVARLEGAAASPGIDLVQRLASALGTTPHDLLPLADAPDPVATLRERARTAFERLVSAADRDTLLMLTPLLAKLAEGAERRG